MRNKDWYIRVFRPLPVGWATKCGEISLTTAAQSSLHCAGMRPAEPLDQAGQGDEVVDPEGAPAGGHHHEDVGLGGIGPGHRQAVLDALGVEEEDPVVPPGLPDPDEDELAVEPRVERMRHPEGSGLTVWFGCS